ncbi:hypothetical protein AB6C54_15720, partial [Vibrio splendidus]
DLILRAERLECGVYGALTKRGVRIQSAVGCGITSKGPWRSSKTPGIQQALSNEYLKKAGLFSLRDGWIAVHYPNQKV